METGDTVWARSKATGVDPRSGKPVTIDVMDICRFADGKLVEHWGVPDRFALLHQIGALPPRPNERNAGVRLTIQCQRPGRGGVRRLCTLTPCRALNLEIANAVSSKNPLAHAL